MIREDSCTPALEDSGATIRLCPESALALDAALPALSFALMEILKQRRSGRNYSARQLDLQTLSRLLWSAFGYNRAAEGRRTAPSAGDSQEIEICVALEEGLFHYDARASLLRQVSARDIRAATGIQDFVASAPVNLIYVANFPRVPEVSRTEQEFYAALDAGHISQNVYLFCSAEGLATVARAMIDRSALAAIMGLSSDQEIILAQSVGYPAAYEGLDHE